MKADDKKTAQEREARRRELLRDVVFLVGMLALGAGVKLQFGWGWALIILGAVLLAMVFWPVRSTK